MIRHDHGTVEITRAGAPSAPTVESSFDPARNSFGFVRWTLAVVVVIGLTGPLGGFLGGAELGTQWSTELSVVGVAVGGFFFISGFLVTRSALIPTSTARFLWRRAVRLVPGLWLALLVTALVIAPIAWMLEHGSLDGLFSVEQEDSPFTFVLDNMLLVPGQDGLAGLGAQNPLATIHNELDWHGSIRTLVYLVGAYLLVATLRATGVLASRAVVGVIAGAIIALATVQSLAISEPGRWIPFFLDEDVLRFGATFAFGMIVAVFGAAIPVDGRLATVAALFAAVCYVKGGWLVLGQYAFCYALLWFALRVTRLSRWERFGDLSYGIFLIAWPVLQLAATASLPQRGPVVFLAVTLVACHAYALLSWVLVERPAQLLKRWVPAPLRAVTARFRSVADMLRTLVARVLGPTRRPGESA